MTQIEKVKEVIRNTVHLSSIEKERCIKVINESLSPCTEIGQQGVEIESTIEEYLSKSTDIRHSHYNNELMYGYCHNGSYELSTIDVKELAEHIANKLSSQPTPPQEGQDELWKEINETVTFEEWKPKIFEYLKNSFTLIKK